LSAEIDLPTRTTCPPGKSVNPAAVCDNGLRPGMYVNTTVVIQRTGVPVLPQEATVVSGNETFCFLLKDGKAIKTSVVRGLRSGTWVEVTKMKIDDRWVKVTGNEDVILGALDELTDGQVVNVGSK
jgi:hypothetical protein